MSVVGNARQSVDEESSMRKSRIGAARFVGAAAIGALALTAATQSQAAGRFYHHRHLGPVAAAATGIGLAAGTILGAAADVATAPFYGSYAYDYAPAYGYAPYPAYAAEPVFAEEPFVAAPASGAYAAAPCNCGYSADGYGPYAAYGYAPAYDYSYTYAARYPAPAYGYS